MTRIIFDLDSLRREYRCEMLWKAPVLCGARRAVGERYGVCRDSRGSKGRGLGCSCSLDDMGV